MPWFDATTVDPAQGSSSLPIGRHPVIIKGSTVTATKAGDGGMLVFSLEVFDGPAKGAQGVYRLNMWNPNPQAAEIAGKQLSAICHVLRTFHLNTPEPKCAELFGKPFIVIVEKQADNNYTQVVAVQDINGNPPSKEMQQQAQQPSAPPMQQQPPMQQPAAYSASPSWPAAGVPAQQPQQPQQQQPAPSWQPPGTGQAQPQQPMQQPQGQMPATPSWGAPAGQPPMQQQPPHIQQTAPPTGQPSWSQQPAGTGAPSWAPR